MDPKVANVLFHQAICQRLSNATRVLVTHQVQFLNSSDVSKIIVMENGTIAAVGTYEELKDAGKLGWIQADDTEVVKESFSNEVVDKDEKTSEIAAFASAQLQSTHSVMNLEAPKQKETHRAAANNYETITELADEDLSHSGVKVEMEMIPLPSIHTTTVHEEEETEVAMYQKLEAEVETLQTPKASPQEGAQGITVAEGRAEGEVTRQTYLGYMKHMGGVGTAMFLIAVLVAGQAAVMSSTIWLATWSRMEREEQQGGRPNTQRIHPPYTHNTQLTSATLKCSFTLPALSSSVAPLNNCKLFATILSNVSCTGPAYSSYDFDFTLFFLCWR